MRSVMSWSAIMIPQACLPVFRIIPSMTLPSSMIFLATGLVLTSLANSCDFLTESLRVIFNSSGIIFAILSATEYSMLFTRAKSRTIIFAPKVPKVMMLATRSSPYFSRTYSTTSSLRRIQKSTSKSGGEIRSKLSMRSKSKPNFNGSISVIFKI